MRWIRFFLPSVRFHSADSTVGRDMVEYLEHGLSYHVAQELKCQDDAAMATRLERAFMMADIHSRQLEVTMSGATVAVCLVKVRYAREVVF
jgi:hypothetical protein